MNTTNRRRPLGGQQFGFTLVEVAIVIAIAALVFGAVTTLVVAQLQQVRATTMRTKLDTIKAALVTFVARNSRLPCPAI